MHYDVVVHNSIGPNRSCTLCHNTHPDRIAVDSSILIIDRITEPEKKYLLGVLAEHLEAK